MKPINTARSILIPAVLLALAACGKKDDPAKAGPGAGAPPPSMVSVITVAPEQVSNLTELPGRVEAVRTAEVRARVGGIVQKRYFTEGSEVRAGQPLYLIDPAPYQATQESARASVSQAEANVQRTEANLALATTKVNRYKGLVDSNAISKQEFDDLASAQKLASADVAAARAALETARASLETAKLNVGYATITAPISGRIGRSIITEGALVTANDQRELSVIQQLDPIYVTLTQSSVDMARLRLMCRNYVPKDEEGRRELWRAFVKGEALSEEGGRDDGGRDGRGGAAGRAGVLAGAPLGDRQPAPRDPGAAPSERDRRPAPERPQRAAAGEPQLPAPVQRDVGPDRRLRPPPTLCLSLRPPRAGRATARPPRRPPPTRCTTRPRAPPAPRYRPANRPSRG